MAIGSFGFSLALMLLLLVVGAQNTDIVSYVCNTETIPTGSPFFDALGNLLADLEDNTANGYDYSYDYKSSNPGSNPGSPTAYGEAICSHALPYDCTTCLISLGDRIWGICNNAIGAQVQLTGCSIRYEQYNF